MEHDARIQSEAGLALLSQVRAFCLQLPETVERIDGFGHTVFRVADKPFARMSEDTRGVLLSIKTALTTQDFLLNKEDSPYIKTPYIGRHGWVTIEGADIADWQETQDLMLEGYSLSAPRRLVKLVRDAPS